MTTKALPELLAENASAVRARLQRIEALISERKWESAEYWESMEAIEERREIDLTFGSTGYEYRVFNTHGYGLRSVNATGDLTTIFMHGYCPLFAYAAHQRTGLPFRIFTLEQDDCGWSGHVGLALAEERYLDVTGSHSALPYTHDPRYTARVIELDEFLAITFGEAHRADPLGFVEELEALLTQQVAHEVLTAESLI